MCWSGFQQCFIDVCTLTLSLKQGGLNHIPPIAMHVDDIPMTAVALQKNGSIPDHVPWEISSACADTKPRDIKVSCIVSGDETSCVSSYESLCSDLQTRLVLCVQKHLMTAKSTPRRCSPWDSWTSENYWCKKLHGGKEGGRHLLKGAYYQQLMVIIVSRSS